MMNASSCQEIRVWRFEITKMQNGETETSRQDYLTGLVFIKRGGENGRQ